MNRLPHEKRRQILSLLVEGASLRSISRVVDVSVNTVMKLQVDAGKACAAYHDATVRGVRASRVQCDEAWAFCYAKQKNVDAAKAAPEGAGDVWTWQALDSDSKLVIAYMVGSRDAGAAYDFIHDMKDRLAHRVQLTTDGHRPYLEAVEDAFGGAIDYAMLIKVYGEPPEEERRRYSPSKCRAVEVRRIEGDPDPAAINTSYVERSNLSMRMGMRRFTRLTNAFSKKLENHLHSCSLYFAHYNFVRIHKSLRVTPAMQAGLTDTLHDMDWLTELVEADQPKPRRPEKYNSN